MKPNNIIVLVLYLVFLSPCVHADNMKLEVIPLHFRSVDEIIPIIKPLVQPGGTVTGMNNQLIVKTTAANLNEIKKILADIDRAARRLLITVRQDVKGDTRMHQHGVSGNYSQGDASISNRNRGNNKQGLALSAKDNKGNQFHYNDLSTHSELDDKNIFQVQTIDGKAAYVQTGQQVPVANRNTYTTYGGVIVEDTIEYHDVSSGFYVLPRVNGDRVTLLVSPQLSRLRPDQGAVFDVQNAETTATGRLGEWLQIGGTMQHTNRNDRENLSSTRRHEQEQHTIFIRVDEINQ